MSLHQQEIWLDQSLYPDLPLYNIGGFILIEGPVDPELFARALRRLAEDCDALRLRLTAANETDGEPGQIFVETMDCPLVHEDFSACPEPDSDARAWADVFVRRPLPLDGGPLHSHALLRLGEARWAWVAVYHHLVTDGFGFGILTRRMGTLYSALAGVGPLPVPAPSYRAHLDRDRAYRESARLADDATYWRCRLTPRPPPLLGIGGRSGLADPSGTTVTRRFPRHLLMRLAEAGRSVGCSLHALLLGGFLVAAARRSRADDLGLAIPVLNRPGARFRETAGLFGGVNPLRLPFDPRQSAADFCRAIVAQLRAGHRHQRFPLSTLNRMTAMDGSLPGTLLDVALSYEPIDMAARFADAPAYTHALFNGYVPTALEIHVRDYNGDRDVVVSLDARKSILAPEDTAAVFGQWHHVLERLPENLDVSVGSLPLMDEHEGARLRDLGQGPELTVPPGTVVDWIYKGAATRRETIAVTDGETTLSYGQLIARADGLAGRLAAAGVGRGDRVAICQARGSSLVVSLLAAWRAGAAYVPLDPDYPPERLATMIDAAGIAVVVAENNGAAQLPDQVVVVPPAVADDEGSGFAAPAMEGSDLAYVIFTSGSTGCPKGVMVSHANVANLVAWLESGIYGLAGGNRLNELLVASFAFDVSVQQTFGALAHGHTLVVAPEAVRLAPNALIAFARRYRVGLINVTPSLLALLLDCGLQDLPDLRVVLCGAEALPRATVAAFDHGRQVLVNMYGPTETTVDATALVCPSRLPTSLEVAPLGRPVANTRLVLRDERRLPVPVGSVGEIHVSGPGVALGYLGRPDLTAERFLDDPQLGRTFRTGDLACWRADGHLAFLGRVDNQVKIRGFRVEPGEIEAVLRDHPSVAESVVVAVGGPADLRLVAYVRVSAPVDREALCGYVTARLPAYLVPAAFVLIDAFPLTANGKLDRSALPAPEFAAGTSVTPPATPTETLLCSLFRDATGTEEIGAEHGFFQIGGNSLSAMRLVARLRVRTGKAIPISALFEHPTPRAFARILDAARRDAGTAPIAGAGSLGPDPAGRLRVALSAGQKRLWTLDRLGRGTAYVMAGGLRLVGPLEEAALGAALCQVVSRHQPLRTVIDAGEEGPLGRLLPHPAPLDLLTVEDFSSLAAEARARAVESRLETEPGRRFDLSRDYSLRARLLRLGTMEHILLLALHHGAADGLSLDILGRELAECYRAGLAGRLIDLPSPPITYADHAVWLEEWLRGSGARERQLAFWRDHLAEAPARLDLPTDHRRTADRRRHAGVRPFSVPSRLGRALEALAREHGVTPYPLLLAAFGVLLGRLARQESVVIGTPVAGRSRPETEGLIGFFVNTLALTVDLSGHPSTQVLLQRTADGVRRMLDNADLPFERVVEDLAISRSLERAPVFQAMLAWQDREDFSLVLDGLAVEPLPLVPAAAKFDLILSLALGPDRGIGGSLEYDASLFDTATVDRWLAALVRLLEAMAAHPAEPVANFDILDGTDRMIAEAFADPPEPAAEPVAPRRRLPLTATERAVTALFSEFLKVPDVALEDDFFALGGHSLLGMSLVTAVHRRLGVSLTLTDLFRNPTPAALTAAMERKAPEVFRPIPRLAEDGPAPLSPAQWRLWILDRLRSGEAKRLADPYTIAGRLDLPARLDVARLRAALAGLMERQPVTRTVVRQAADGTPYQQVLPVAEALVGAWVEEEVARATAEECLTTLAGASFDLERGPLVAVRLLHFTDAPGGILFVRLHHIAADGWSVRLFLETLSALYAESEAPFPAVRYTDYAAWYADLLADPAFADGHRSWWRDELAVLPILELPTDRPRPAVRDGAGGRVTTRWTATRRAALEALARREGATPFMVLLALWAVVLGRHGGTDDVVIGSPVAGRWHDDLGEVMGMFVNMLPIRVRPQAAVSFRDLVGAVRETTLAAQEHQAYPFDRLVDELELPRDPARSPVFDVMLVYQEDTLPALDLADGAAPVMVDTGTAKLDLTLTATAAGDGYELDLEYAAALFEPETAARLLERFDRLAEAALAAPRTAVGDLAMTSPEEVSRLVEWGTGPVLTDRRGTAADWIWQVARSRRSAIAVTDGVESLTYGDLIARADGLASRLAAAGVGRGVKVGVCQARGAALVVSLLAVWRIGAAYVPLDPAYPAERLAWMIEDAGIGVAVADDTGRPSLPAVVSVVAPATAADAGIGFAGPALDGSDLAYVIFTSGSTGRPKGVMVSQDNVATEIQALAETIGLEEADVWLSVTTPSFDPSVAEYFLPLSVGARVHVVSAVEARDGAVLADRIADLGITVLQGTPTTWHLLRAVDWPGAPGLTALCGGEALASDMAIWLADKCRAAWNVYGPTETTVWATAELLLRGAQDSRVSIGRPLPGYGAWVRQGSGQVAPPGVAGEIVIGGPGMTRGYLGQPGLTAERFTADPLLGRIYRTGDLGYWLADGRLVCLGRLDDQVKIRGFRIELGEIEARLRGHEQVADCAAGIHGGRLVAYVVGTGGPLNREDLRSHLAARLPGHMLPEAYVLLDRLPLTPAGKLDRRRLPAPDASAAARGQRVAPRTASERAVTELFTELLGIADVGVEDDFFALGGQSLLGMRLVNAIRSRLGVSLSLAAVFGHPTPAALAAAIDQHQALKVVSTGPMTAAIEDRERIEL